MRDVAIIGVGMTPSGEHWDSSLRQLGADAVQKAIQDGNVTHDDVDALYIGNAYGAPYSSQSQLGALIADHSRLLGAEAFTVEAGDASGGAAFRTGYMAVASGLVDCAVVVGVEKSTDSIAGGRVLARNSSIDADFEAVHGASLTALAALVMQRYLHEYGLTTSDFEGFSINAHANGTRNPNAMFRNTLRAGAFGKAAMVSAPVNLFDGAPDADGAAAVILMPMDRAVDQVSKPIHIIGSGMATDRLAIQDREHLLRLSAIEQSFAKSLAQADINRDEIDVFELHDGYTILTTLALEAMGYAERGTGWRYANDSGRDIALDGSLPISTFGGLKARGNPAGATGIYQVVEATLQLRGEAGDNQVNGARVAATQNIGGIGATAVTHILRRED